MPSHPESEPVGTSTPAASPRPRILITIDEVARRLSVTPRQVYRLINAGELRTVHIGRAARVPEESYNRYLDRLTAHSPFPD